MVDTAAMAAEGSTKAVVTAMFANLGIAVTKFVAFLLTASSSMLAESVHSVADTSNQVLLLLGGKRAKRAATPDHPFGYGRERYVYGSSCQSCSSASVGCSRCTRRGTSGATRTRSTPGSGSRS
jgi:divalent metal cation (Fe/Co/Zn/Cd) transporter